MNRNPEDSPAGATVPIVLSGRGLNAAQGLPQAPAAAPGAASPAPGGTWGTHLRAGGTDPPSVPSAPEPAPGRSAGAGCGQVESTSAAPSRTAQAAASPCGGLGTPSRGEEREGNAVPGARSPGAARSSPPARGGAGGAREGETGVRTMRAGLPPAIDPEGAGQRQVNPAPSDATGLSGKAFRDADLVEPVRELLAEWGGPWIIENVEGAGLPGQDDLFGAHGVMLCGTMFGRALYRHRWFSASFPVKAPGHPRHLLPASKAGHWKPGTIISVEGHCSPIGLAREVMGIDWTSRDELAEAIPPCYTNYLGGFLMDAVRERQAA